MANDKRRLSEVEFESALARTSLFEGLEEGQMRQLRSLLRQKSVCAGSELMREGESDGTVYVLLRGTVKVHIERSEGAGVILAICGSGEVLGEMGALDGQGHSATVSTLEECVLAAFSGDDFVRCLYEMPRLSLNLAASASRRLRSATAQIQSLARRDVMGRVAAQLLIFADQYGQSVPDSRAPGGQATDLCLSFKQSDLADLIGSSRVRVNQALTALRRSAAIDLHEGRILILDRPLLESRR
jgi:CRP/FNR family cyclic AMP-dependent transcriptional regulator